MTPRREKPIIVGVDGSAPASAAVSWATREAILHRVPLHLVYALGTGWDLGRRIGEVGLHNQSFRDEGAAALAAAAHTARHEAGGDSVQISTELAWPTPVRALAKRSRSARLLVLGTRGMDVFDRAVLGSVSAALVRRSTCPVVVVPAAHTPAESSPVLVGVDGSATSVRAVEVAFAQAAARHVDVVALLARPRTDDHVAEHGPAQWAQATLSASLAGHAQEYPQISVQRIVAEGDPARLILDAAQVAQLIVLGSRGRGGVTGFTLGSVSRAVLDNAQVPVLIARPRPDDHRLVGGMDRRAAQRRRLVVPQKTKGLHSWSRSFWSTITKSFGTA
ncbi:universal stress protein [Nocardia neocaledoniensis]|uniref:universal stress protein n=1 Tax=Nocardia neocaledoniensis TaxID=236511 RepID=UPI0024580276|nr:universal stress protein [Nocardia neocaledoniensis]